MLTGNKMFWDLPPGTANTCKELDSPEDEGVEPRDYMPYSYMIMAQVSTISGFWFKKLGRNTNKTIFPIFIKQSSFFELFHRPSSRPSSSFSLSKVNFFERQKTTKQKRRPRTTQTLSQSYKKKFSLQKD